MIKRLLVIIFSLIFGFSCKRDNIHGDVKEIFPAALIKITGAVTENLGGYYVGLPARYELDKDHKNYPVILCLPGAGVYGPEPEKLLFAIGYGTPNLIANRTFPPVFKSSDNFYSFIILAPQFISQPSNEQVHSFLEYALLNYNIDQSRIYVLGASVGGRVAADYAGAYPNQIAALVVMAGSSDVDLELKCKNIVDANLPVWAFHNRDDEAWPIAAQNNFISMLNSFQPSIPPIYTIFTIPEGEKNHDAWTRATNPDYKENNMNIYEWMLSYNR